MNQLGKLINRIPGLCLLISSLPGLALKTHVEFFGFRSASLAMSISVLEALPGKLDIKRHSPSILGINGEKRLSRLSKCPDWSESLMTTHVNLYLLLDSGLFLK